MLRSRYASVDADHAIVVHPGIASQPAIVDSFCAYHADRGVDVWTPDDQFSREGSADSLVALGAHVAETTRLPVFLVGSVRSATVIWSALQVSDVFSGAVLIGDASPPVLSEQLTQSLGLNTKPVLYVIGATGARSGLTAAPVGTGPVEVHTHPDDVNRLMLTNPAAFSDVVLEWCVRQLSNHLNPTWRFE
ncbi:MAG: hypothetical protein QOD90_3211, partial [Mycobacterium sp.]|nr:hypothetical protein [Mycobacterium sp.]